MGAHRYCIAGLSVSSEIALPGLIALAGNDLAAEVTIREGTVALDGANDSTPGGWRVDGAHMFLSIPELARFRLTAGREIAFEAEHGTPVEDVVPFLAGSVFGALLHQRGLATFHASAVRVADRAVLFCGPSGAGKSTLAAALGQRGYPVVTDDLSAIDFANAPTVQPDARHLKLWADAIEALGLADRRGAAVHRRYDKRFVAPTSSSTGPLPVGAVYLLHPAGSRSSPDIEPLPALEAVALLVRNAYRPRLIEDMGQHDRYFRAGAAIADAAGVFRLTRPQDLAVLPQVADCLESHWATTGALERTT